jgi:nucleotide-binding universal stress UspA family protein
VDDSDAAEAVAETGRWLANRLGADLVLIHVTEEPPEKTGEIVTSVRVRLGLGERDDVRVVEGTPAVRLIHAAKQEDADLLVVGSRGRGSIQSAVLGSVSRELATGASCPVVVVPPHLPDRREIGQGEDGESVVCGVDGSDHAVAAARLAAELAEGLGLRLVVVHALPDVKSFVSYPGGRTTAPPLSGQPDARARLAEQIANDAVEAAGGGATAVVETGPPWDVLEEVADREAGRLLVVAARGQSDLRAALFGSVASRLATSARRPVVVLPERAESGRG